MTRIPIAKPYLDAKEEATVIETLRSGWISQGPRCAEFERALADFVGVKHAVAVNSGTSAIQLALIACGVRPGDEVIVPAFNCIAAVHPVVAIGAQPVLVDAELDTYGVDPLKIETAITEKTKALIVAHMFGGPAQIGEVIARTSRFGLKVIEDAALGLGARVADQALGTFGDAACLSFHPRKMITTGEGGMVLTDSGDIAAQVECLRNYGAMTSAWQRHSGKLSELPEYAPLGFNYKLTDIQASLGVHQVRKLPTIIDIRRCLAETYHRALRDIPWLTLPKEYPNTTHVYQSYVCRVGDFPSTALEGLRNRLVDYLDSHGVATVQGAQAIALVASYATRFSWKSDDFPCAALADRQTLALPIYPGLPDVSLRRVVQLLHQFSP